MENENDKLEKEIQKVKIIVDGNPSIGYETNNWLSICKLPLMWMLAFWVALKKKILNPNLQINTFWFDGISPICREIKDNATTWRALDIIYNYEFKRRGGIEGKITDFWLKIFNAQAVRNRLKLVKEKLREEIEKIAQKKSEIRLLSIASGSAQGVIEVMKEFKEKPIRAIFLDLDSTAIEHSKQLAQKVGLINRITFVNKGANHLEEAIKGFNPHIIEVVGFLEYRLEEKARKLVEKLCRLLLPGGVLLISNTADNLERLFLHYVVNWPMVYRSATELAQILIRSGFNSENCEIIYEPMKIHGIAICRKSI